MNFTVTEKQLSAVDQKVLAFYYREYARKLLTYTVNHYLISEDDATSLVYKTIYRMAEVHDNYEFATPKKRNAFIFTTHVNYIRNFFRDEKSFEHKCKIVDLETEEPVNPHPTESTNNIALTLLQAELEKLEEWQRILLLMRGQDMPYSEIAPFLDRPEKQLKVYYARLKKMLYARVNDGLKKINKPKK